MTSEQRRLHFGSPLAMHAQPFALTRMHRDVYTLCRASGVASWPAAAVTTAAVEPIPPASEE